MTLFPVARLPALLALAAAVCDEQKLEFDGSPVYKATTHEAVTAPVLVARLLDSARLRFGLIFVKTIPLAYVGSSESAELVFALH